MTITSLKARLIQALDTGEENYQCLYYGKNLVEIGPKLNFSLEPMSVNQSFLVLYHFHHDVRLSTH